MVSLSKNVHAVFSVCKDDHVAVSFDASSSACGAGLLGLRLHPAAISASGFDRLLRQVQALYGDIEQLHRDESGEQT